MATGYSQSSLNHEEHEGRKESPFVLCALHVLHALRGSKSPTARCYLYRIGKKSPIHKLAIDTLRRREQPDLTLSLEDILGEFGRVRKKRQ